MTLTKKDRPKLYGPNGLYAKFNYIKEVISSCKTVKQVQITAKWGIHVITMDNILDDRNLNPPFSLFPNELSYMLEYNRYCWDICEEIRRFATEKEKEL